MARHQPLHYAWRTVDVTGADGVVESTWAMVPSLRYRKVAERQFGAGGEYVLEPVEERSMASHSQYFAALHDLFDSIPENLQARWPSFEHWRAWLLIECDWCDESEFVLEDDKQAKNLADLIRSQSPYARIAIHKSKVIVRTAKSQSIRSMNKADFQASKDAVLNLASEIVGVTRTEAIKNAGRAA